jgi:hypothetical protein
MLGLDQGSAVACALEEDLGVRDVMSIGMASLGSSHSGFCRHTHAAIGCS